MVRNVSVSTVVVVKIVVVDVVVELAVTVPGVTVVEGVEMLETMTAGTLNVVVRLFVVVDTEAVDVDE